MLFLILLCLTSFNVVFLQLIDMEAMQEKLTHPERFLFQNKCYVSIGDECFFNGGKFFDPKYRSMSVVPYESKKIQFLLYTPSNKDKEFKLKSKMKSLQKSQYNCDLETIIITHGFQGAVDEFKKVKDTILEVGSYNVIVVDWSNYDKPPYIQAVANTRTCGARLALLIRLLMKFCNAPKADKFHLVGHSLGAHVVGYAGKRIPNVKRITGLDPASHDYIGMPDDTKLSVGDADYVDVIHTNGMKEGDLAHFGFGMFEAMGDEDFYANDGNDQPGCDITSPEVLKPPLNFTALYGTMGCSHTRAIQLFKESVKSNNGCEFRAVQCDSVEDFYDGKCPPENRRTTTLGFYNQKIPDLPPKTSFYFVTDGTEPFCVPDSCYPTPKSTEAPTETTTPKRKSLWESLFG